MAVDSRTPYRRNAPIQRHAFSGGGSAEPEGLIGDLAAPIFLAQPLGSAAPVPIQLGDRDRHAGRFAGTHTWGWAAHYFRQIRALTAALRGGRATRRFGQDRLRLGCPSSGRRLGNWRVISDVDDVAGGVGGLE